MPARTYYVYVLANRRRRVYVGVTRDLLRRLREHRHSSLPHHTRRYNVTALVYFETFSDVRLAIEREKQLKRWPKWRKDRLIDASNPEWKDLSDDWQPDANRG